MSRRLLTARLMLAVLVALVAAGILGSRALKGANLVNLTPLASLQGNNPIGIDWFPATDQVMISDNYDGDVNHLGNFALVDKVTGSIATQIPTPFGYTNEIYFASVRPGSPSAAAGWPVNHVFYAEGGNTGPDGALDPECIGEMDGTGAVVNSCKFFLPGETRIKRGGVRFDYAGIAGGDLIVVASNDNDADDSTVYRINKTGVITTVLAYTGLDANGLHVHLEGIATVPVDAAAYGAWSGKILVAAERYSSAGGQGAVFAIDPNCNNACAPTISQLNTPTEDIWVVPANSTFYGVDYAENGTLYPQRLWTAPASEWTPFVGHVLLAKEHGAQLYTADWNGSGFTVTRIYDGFFGQSKPFTAAIQWEHITFVPSASPRAKIEIHPNATNEVGHSHTFTVTLSKDPTGNSPYVPAPGEHVDVTLTDTNGASHSAPTGSCTNAGANTDVNGQCTITFTSNSAGQVTGHATSTLTVSGSTLTVATDGTGDNSVDAVKTFVDANILITPNGVNHVGLTHVFTAHVNINAGNGAGFVNAPDGTQISFTIDSGPGGFTTVNPCTTAGGSGSCQIGLTSNATGTTTVSAHTNVTVGGVSLHRDTKGSGANSGPASKLWVNAAIQIAPNATNEVGHPHTFTVTLLFDTGSGFVPAGANQPVTVTLQPTGTANPQPAGPFNLTTNAAGQVQVTFSSATPGTVIGHASWTGSVGGSAPFTVQTDGNAPNSGDAVKTYVDANIQVGPDGVNLINHPHTFTGHVNVNDGTGYGNAPAGTLISFTIDSGPGSFITANPCATIGTTGSCTIILNSLVTGTTIVSAHTDVTVGGVSMHRDTNGVGANSGPATKQWVNYVLSTQVLNASNQDVTNTIVPAGTVVHDEASVQKSAGAPAAAPKPTGTVDFTLYDNGTCNGNVVATDPGKPLGANGKADSATFTTAGPGGQMSYLAHYNGDAIYPAADIQCEPFTVAGPCQAGFNCNFNSKTFSIGPSSMEGAIKISAGDWVNGGYSFKFDSAHIATTFAVDAKVEITGQCLTPLGVKIPGVFDTITIPLGTLVVPPNPPVPFATFPPETIQYQIPASSKATDWLPTGDANNVLSWQGSIQAPATMCGGGGNKLDASKGAVFTATTQQAPPTASLTDFRFKFRDPAAKGKPNTNCLDTADPNRAKADVCGASWSGTKSDP
jgi:hypothetical protein